MKETALFANGCFWCTEAIFAQLKGVTKVISGYAGGTVADPTYEQVSTGTTGHAESLRIEFDPEVIPYRTLCEVFFATHDPTTLNRQGNDIGAQYRSAIFYYDKAQRTTAETVKSEIDIRKLYDGPIVTAVVPYTNFYPAEKEHVNYYRTNLNQAYCRFVIAPKVVKFRASFDALLRNDARP